MQKENNKLCSLYLCSLSLSLPLSLKKQPRVGILHFMLKENNTILSLAIFALSFSLKKQLRVGILHFMLKENNTIFSLAIFALSLSLSF